MVGERVRGAVTPLPPQTQNETLKIQRRLRLSSNLNLSVSHACFQKLKLYGNLCF